MKIFLLWLLLIAIIIAIIVYIIVASISYADYKRMQRRSVITPPSRITPIPNYSTVSRGRFIPFDTDVCYQPGSCFGQNPDSPYLRLFLPTRSSDGPNSGVGSYRLNVNEAVILDGITPSGLKYFGITNYLYSRGSTDSVPFASLSDSINETEIPLSTNFKIIITGSKTIGEDLRNSMIRDPTIVTNSNYIIVMPIPMGDIVTNTDNLLTVLRTAYFNDVNAGREYLNNTPITAYKVRRNTSINNVLYTKADIALVSRPTTINEIELYGSEFESYVADQIDLIRSIPGVGGISEIIEYKQFLNGEYNSGYDCIEKNVSCLGDNRDSTYFVSNSFNLRPDQVFISFSVNHVKTGKAIFNSQSLYNDDAQFGLISMGSPEIPVDDKFYGFVFSRTKFEQLSIYPIAIVGDDSNITDSTNLSITERAYVQPGSSVSPSFDTVMPSRGYIITMTEKL